MNRLHFNKQTLTFLKKLNRNILVGCFALFFCIGTANGQATDLIISEYVEGSSNNKYIEIYNGTGTAVDLSDYELQLFPNGAKSPNNTYKLNSDLASLDNGTTLVLRNHQAKIYSSQAYAASITNFNGDDAVALLKSGTVIDVLGTIGKRISFGKDKTLIRKSNITSPNTTYTASEWEVKSKDDVANLGSHTLEETILPKVNIELSSTTAAEADQTAITITATASEPVSGSQTVDLTIGGAGIYTSDYTLSGTQITFEDGETSATSTLTIVDDSDKEGNETLTIQLANPSSGIELGNAVSGEITITDNDNSTGGDGAASDLIISEYVEGSSNNKYLEIYNGTGSAVDLSEYSIQLYSNGGLTANSTYKLNSDLSSLENEATLVLKNSSAKIYSGQAYVSSVTNFNGDDAIALLKASKVIDIIGTIGQTAKFGKDKTLIRKSNITSPNTTYTESEWEAKSKDDVANLGSHTLDKPVLPKVNIEFSSTLAAEADQTMITITATASEPVSGSQTVDLTISGTNINASDYTLSETQITFGNGETSGSTILTIVDDSDKEKNEIMTVQLANPSSGIELGNAVSGEITIMDNDDNTGGDGPASDLIISEYVEGSSNNKYLEIYNGTGSAVDLSEYSIQLYSNGGSTANSTYKLNSDLSSLENGATLVLRNSSAKIYSGQAYVSSVVNFNGDDAVAMTKNGNVIDVVGTIGERVNFGKDKTLIRKSNITSPNVTYTESEWEVKSKDDVADLGSHTMNGSGLPKVNLSLLETTGKEADQTVITFMATASKAVSGPQTLGVKISGEGIDATDYNLSVSTVTIADGETTSIATLTILDDDKVEGNETLTIQFVDPSSGIELGNSTSGNISIIDNDVSSSPVVSLSLSENSASEANKTTVTLTATASDVVSGNQTVSVNISGAGITASDYTLSATEITISDGNTTSTATLTIVDDSEEEGQEILTVQLTNPSTGIELGSNVSSSITISDNDKPTGGTILDNYVYLDPTLDNEGNITVALTPKEYVQTVSESHHMNSTGYNATYYSSAIGFSGSVLREKVKDIVSTGAKELNYSKVWEMCESGDQNPKDANQVWQIYVEKGIAKTEHVSGSSGWNREHVWAKSHGNFGTTLGRGTDGHHLRAANARENSVRGSKDFANSSPGYTPPKSARGDVARMIFYMATRYEMTVDNQVKSRESLPRHGKLSDLLKWHEEDPVDPYEIRRNNIIFGFQNNRNPFVDHPELVQYIFGEAKDLGWTGGSNGKPLKIKLAGRLSDFGMVKYGTESTVQSVNVSASDLTENITVTAPQHFLISKDNTTFSQTLTFVQNEGVLNTTALYVKFVPESAFGTETVAKIKLESGEDKRVLTVKGTESDPALVPVTLLSENFESTTHQNWIYQSMSGERNWEAKSYNSNTYAQMSAYDKNSSADLPTVAWLISPKINLAIYRNETLSFTTKNGYYKGTTLKALISTDFDGQNLSTATWQELPATIDEKNHGGYGKTFISSGEIDLSAYEGTAYIAFKYEGNRNGLTTTYQVDDILVKGIAIPQKGSISSNAAPEGFTFDYTTAGSISKMQSYELQFSDIESNLTVEASQYYQLSLDQSQWTQELSIVKDANSSQTVFVRFAPSGSVVNGYSGEITHTAKAAATYTVNLSSKASSDILDATTLTKDKTLDVVTWNLEWFGIPEKSKSASSFNDQLNGVSQKIVELDADIYALQEVVVDDLNGNYFQKLVEKLNEVSPGAYEGIVGPRYSFDDREPNTNYPAQRICYLYKTSSVSELNSFSMFSDIYPNSSTSAIPGYTGNEPKKFWSSGRLPFFLEATVTVDGKSENIKLINIHAKCCKDGADRRRADAEFLLNELNTTYANDNLIVLGDYNDYEKGSIAGGSSPYRGFWADNNKNFRHEIGTKIDHIAVSNELYDEADLLDKNTSIVSSSISDHDLVMLRLKLNQTEKSDQTISFKKITDKTFGDQAFNLTATASSGLPVTFEVMSGSATITNNVVTITGVGKVEIKATQTGNSVYSAAPAILQSFNVSKADQEVVFEAIGDIKIEHGKVELKAEATSKLPVNFEIVEGEGTLEGNIFIPTIVGLVTIRATQEGGDFYNTAFAEQSFIVNKSTAVGSLESFAARLYPNPTADYIQVELSHGEEALVQLFDLNNRLISSQKVSGKQTLDVTTLKEGTHLVIIQYNNNLVVKKLLKIK